MLLFVEVLDEKIAEAGIDLRPNPKYQEQFQIDEGAFEDILDEGVYYHNPRARQDDINSVRSIYAIRGNRAPTLIERSRAVLVTSNAAFAGAAWNYGQRYESSRAVSSVITNFSLANTSWLKSPMKALSLPRTQMLAFAYAAMEPTEEWLSKFVTEVDRLQAKGTISERDHQLLRSSPMVYEELMYLTLGEDVALNSETIVETLSRVSTEIRKEELEKLSAESHAHSQTKESLSRERSERERMIANLVTRCEHRARKIARGVAVFAFLLVALILLGGVVLRSVSPTLGWSLVSISILATAFEVASFTFGTSIRGLHDTTLEFVQRQLLRRESDALEIDLEAVIHGEASSDDGVERSN